MDMDKKKNVFACLMVEFEINYFLEETAEMMLLHLRKQINVLCCSVIHHTQRKIQKRQNTKITEAVEPARSMTLNVSQSV